MADSESASDLDVSVSSERISDSESTVGQGGSSDLGSSSGVTGPTVNSLLSVLKSPTPSHLAWKRKLNVLPPTGKRRGRGSVASAPKFVSAYDRAKEYPGEQLTVSSSKLFCLACSEELTVKKSVVDLHCKSLKHTRGKERLASKEKRERDIVKSLQEYDASVDPSGETLPESTRVHRVKVVTALLKAGIPLNKLDSLRDILEERSFALSDSANLRQLVPFILENEINQLKEEISGKHVGIVTTHVSEALVVVLRFVNQDWVIKQQVCRMMLLAKSVTGEELARELITALSTELSIPPHLVVSAMRDRASVNDVAMRTVKVLYNHVMDIGCFSHTLDHVGERMQTPILDEFVKAWVSLFAHSPKTRLAWRAQTQLSPPSYSSTRWWSKFEVIQQIHNTFGDVSTFLHGSGLPVTTTGKLLEILEDQPKCRKPKMELSITVDAMEPFVKTTYVLEGDGPLALIAR
jgi:hypothetical protein